MFAVRVDLYTVITWLTKRDFAYLNNICVSVSVSVMCNDVDAAVALRALGSYRFTNVLWKHWYLLLQTADVESVVNIVC